MKDQQKTSPEWAFISIGSNIEPEKYLPIAVHQLRHIGNIIAISRVYQNPPVGRPEQADFLNAAVLLQTTHSPLEIRAQLRKLESDLGRVRTEDKFAARTIDLDLCLLGDRVIDTPEITLPDPDLLTRAHLAIPMSELSPDFQHPISSETLQQIADRLRPGATLTPRLDVTQNVRQAAKTP